VADTDRLDQAQAVARRAVADYLRAIGARAAYPGLSYTVSFDAARDAVTVRIDAPLDLPLTIPGSPHRPVVGAEGTAVVQVEQ
jgi:hypothetical protein